METALLISAIGAAVFFFGILPAWNSFRDTIQKKIDQPSTTAVSCAKCRCLIQRDLAYKVDVKNRLLRMVSPEYFCQNDKPAYDEKILHGYGDIEYRASVRVREDGTPVGYQKEVLPCDRPCDAAGKFSLPHDRAAATKRKR